MDTISFSTVARPLKLPQGRVEVGELPTAETVGMLARKVLSSSWHADSRELARAVFWLLARSTQQS
jgi:hypothetical protein